MGKLTTRGGGEGKPESRIRLFREEAKGLWGKEERGRQEGCDQGTFCVW